MKTYILQENDKGHLGSRKKLLTKKSDETGDLPVPVIGDTLTINGFPYRVVEREIDYDYGNVIVIVRRKNDNSRALLDQD